MPRFIPLITALVTAPVLFAQQKELAEARGHLAQGDPFAAAAAARASLAVGETAEAWYFIGHGQLAADEADSARSSLERCLVLDPDHADAVFELGLALDERGEHEQAIGQFRRYAALAPMDERGPVQEAFVRLSGLNDAAGAERILDSLMTRFPSSAAVLPDQRLLAQGLADALAARSGETPETLGDIVLRAQGTLTDASVGVREVLLTFNLLGDPTLKPRF